jgi:hypothetical protein
LAGCPNQQPYPILTCLLLSLLHWMLRGIAINSCIGKLFNSILNKRLDKYLETHNIINPCQIGFTSKSRTSDHMFVNVEILGLDHDKALCNLNTAFKDFLYISSFPCLKIPLDVNFIPKYS